MTDAWPNYDVYQTRTDRVIPVVVLTSGQTDRWTDRRFDGVRVVELAQWVFVPVAGALLADWGADVVHIERPRAIPIGVWPPRASAPTAGG